MIILFPAIDIIRGEVVRLREGNFNEQKEYGITPLALAQQYETAGFRHLHLVDLDGAREGIPQNLDILEEITARTSLQVDFGGGLRSAEAVEQAFFAGAWKMNVGSVAVREPQLLRRWMSHLGDERFIAAIDVRDGRPAVSGWQEESNRSWEQVVEDLVTMGVQYVSVTAIRRDGNMQGADLDLYREIRKAFPELQLIASGGVASVDEIEELDRMGVWGVILGKALLEGQIKTDELKKFM
jgi:phosphoribosylformimino-5-aminoimidazole carboxamide ribotide isomerase